MRSLKSKPNHPTKQEMIIKNRMKRIENTKAIPEVKSKTKKELPVFTEEEKRQMKYGK